MSKNAFLNNLQIQLIFNKATCTTYICFRKVILVIFVFMHIGVFYVKF